MNNELLRSIDRLHTTELGAQRIKRNLSLDLDMNINDIIDWCKANITSPDAVITKNGKNWYVSIDSCIITVNAYSHTVITAHREK